MANICLTKQRRDPDRRLFYLEGYRNFLMLGIEAVPVEFDLVLTLGATYRLSAYDASYLAVALSMAMELYTLDRRLAAAASVARN